MTERDAETLLRADRNRRLRETVLMECKIYVGEWPGPSTPSRGLSYSGGPPVQNIGINGYAVKPTVGVRSGAGYRMW